MSPYTSTTYYHCDSCREMNSGPVSTCPACRKILCPKCNRWGLCPDHFAAISYGYFSNLAIRALLDDIPALGQVRPIFHGAPILLKEGVSGTVPAPLTPFTEARNSTSPTIQRLPEEPPQEIPLWQTDQTTAEWERLVSLKFPVRYCSHCNIDHPAFARYCIFCGKPLPESG